MISREIPISEHQDDVAAGKGAEEIAASSEAHVSGEGIDHDAVIEMLEARVRELEGESEMLREQRLRAIADLDNTRRRAEQDVLTTVQYANENLLKKLLPIVDDFERSVESVPSEKEGDPFVQGIAMIRNKLAKLLEEEGVERISALGKEFDVNMHEALMRQPSDQPENTVVQELEPGYLYKGKVLRHTKVIVSA
ncbi:MAG: nucleotide exchange factor GrpE [Ignavibacteriae bacterium]|nr:nucleotide exchange factor GrpE [Ignavibacteriota bacterium]MCB9216467.1 nucleotide exchange factor GrpE [Ignavibacteria bacterium]